MANEKEMRVLENYCNVIYEVHFFPSMWVGIGEITYFYLYVYFTMSRLSLPFLVGLRW